MKTDKISIDLSVYISILIPLLNTHSLLPLLISDLDHLDSLQGASCGAFASG